MSVRWSPPGPELWLIFEWCRMFEPGAHQECGLLLQVLFSIAKPPPTAKSAAKITMIAGLFLIAHTLPPAGYDLMKP